MSLFYLPVYDTEESYDFENIVKMIERLKVTKGNKYEKN